MIRMLRKYLSALMPATPVNVLIARADRARNAGEFRNAAILYSEALSFDSQNAAIHIQCGHMFKECGDLVNAEAHYMAADRLCPDDAELALQLGHFYKVANRLQDAARAYEKALHLSPDWLEPARELAELRLSSPIDEHGVLIARADRARDAGKFREAAVLYSEALSVVPDNAGIHIQCGHMLKECGNLAEAEAHYLAAGRLTPSDADLALQLGHFYKIANRLDEAAKAYEKALFLRPDWPEAAKELDRLQRRLTVQTEAGPSAAPSSHSRLPAVKSLFPGSILADLTAADTGAVMKTMIAHSTPADRLARVSASDYSPRISIILPIYNTSARLLREVVQSVFAQTYSNWELCVADDSSSTAATIEIRRELETANDPRIKVAVLPRNLGIAGASQGAFAISTGEYVAFLDHDDLLTPNALSEVVSLLRQNRDIDYIYSDHIMIDEDSVPLSLSWKPQWSPEFLLSTNYIVHFKVVRADLIKSIGGLAQLVSHVQDLGMTLRLMTANARIAYLPKPIYLWRQHDNSVAASTEAKPGIEHLLMAEYDRYLAQSGIAASQTWPEPFHSKRIGVFKLEFGRIDRRITLVVWAKSATDGIETVRARLSSDVTDRVDLHIIGFARELQNNPQLKAFSDSGEFKTFLSRLNTEIVVFLNSTAHRLTPSWLDDLIGYLALDKRIGAVGGKVLDEFLRVRGGGLLVDRDGQYHTICGGEFDNSTGHWHIGQIASNVDAVSASLLATRLELLLSQEDLDFEELGEAWSLAYCAGLREKDFRIVYNPFSKIYDPGDMRISAAARERIAEIGRSAKTRRYYLEF